MKLIRGVAAAPSFPPFAGRLVRVALAAVLAAWVALPAAAANISGAGPALASHRAAYEIKLLSSDKSAGPSSARGLMAYEFSDSCERWIVENRIVLDLVYGDEQAIRIDWSFTSWEAKDGRRFGFRLSHKRNGRIEEDFKGTAELDADGRGKATFTGSEEAEIALPKGTLFPTAHMLASFKAAAAGRSNFIRPMFDGGGMDNPYDVNINILPAAKAGDAAAKQARDLLTKAGFPADVPVWRYQAAFFPHNQQRDTPAFEMDVSYRRDGIAEWITQDFGDFKLGMTPRRIERVKGGC